MKLIDFAERLVPADQIKSAGYDGALVYVSELRPGADFDFKPVTREYADALRAEGLHVVSCYQYGKPGWPTPSDYTRGYEGGVADAQTALRLHAAAGGPDSAPIFFSVDEDIDLDTWNSLAVRMVSGNQLGTGREPHRHLRACQSVWMGRPRRCHRALNHRRKLRGRGRRGRGLTVSASPRPCFISM